MSYALVITGDARADLAVLDVWLQEEVWDALDLVCANPLALVAAPAETISTYGFNRSSGGVTYFVTLTIVCNDAAKVLTVLGVSVEADA